MIRELAEHELSEVYIRFLENVDKRTAIFKVGKAAFHPASGASIAVDEEDDKINGVISWRQEEGTKCINLASKKSGTGKALLNWLMAKYPQGRFWLKGRKPVWGFYQHCGLQKTKTLNKRIAIFERISSL